MRQYLFLALLGLALARIQPDSWNQPSGIQEWDDYSSVEREVHMERDIKDTAFQPGKEYKYFYDGQVMNGIPRSSKQHSASRIQAVVKLQMESQDTMLLKLERIRMGKLNRKVQNPRRNLPFRAFEPVQMDEQFKNELEKPIKFQYTNGMIKNIHKEADDTPISMNVKRGILNLLQVNTQEEGSTESTDQRLTNAVSPQLGRSKFFRVMEKTLEGECETLYSISKLPRNINRVFRRQDSSEEEPMSSQPRLNVTKSINFERCNQRPTVKYNFRNSEQCKSCDPKFQESNKYLKSSSVIKYNLLGNRRNFLIEQANAEGQHSIEFYSESGSFINVYINQKLNLFKTGSIQSAIRQQNPKQSQSDMIYSRKWDLLNEQFQLNSQNGHPNQLRNKQQNFVEQVQELLKKLSQVVESNKNQPLSILAVNKYQLLVSALRKATPNELQQIHQVVYENPSALNLNEHQRKVIQDILEPAAATAGTEATIKHLCNKIKQNKLRKTVAVSALRQLSNARVASKISVNHVKNLCEESVVQSHQQLKRSCYLSLGSLMKAACNSKNDKLAVDAKSSTSTRCTMSDKKSFVQHLINKVKSTSKWENKILYLKAIGNSGIDMSVFELEKIIHNTEQFQPANVRYEAVVALRQLTTQMPQKIQKALMPIFMNPREPSALRQVSAYFILQSQPERPVLDMMAKQIDREPIRQVAMFTYQLMSELANSTNPCQQQLASNLKLALQLTRQVNPSILDSKVARTSLHSWLRKIGMDINLFELVANNTVLPKTLGGTLNTNMLGYFNRDLFTAAINMEGIERLIPKLWQQDGSLSSLDELLSRHPRSTQNYKQQLRNIFEKLNIRARDLPQQPKAYGYWRFHGQETGYLPVNKELINYMIENGYLSGSEWETALRSGETKHVKWHHAVMLEDAEMKVPTPLGLPLIVKHKLPVFMKVDGTVKGKMSDNRNLDVTANLKPSIAMKHEHTAEVWSPSAPAGVRVRSQLRAQLPISGKIHYNSQSKSLKVIMETPATEKELLRVDIQPITFTRQQNTQKKVYKEAMERIVQSEEINRVERINQHYRPASLNFQVFSRYTPQIPEPRGNWVPMCPLSGPNHLSIRTLPPKDGTRQLELTINPSGSYNLNQPLKSRLLKSLAQESESNSLSSEETETNRFESSRQRYGQLVAELKTKGGSQPRHYKANLKASGNLKGQAGQLQVELSRLQPHPYQICLNSEILYPSSPMNRQSLKGKKVLKQTELRWGQNCQSNNFVTISATAERTRRQERHEQVNMEEYHECQTQEQESPIACHDYLRQAGFLNKYNINIKYNNVPVMVRNATNKIYNALKTYYYMNADIADVQVRNPQNQIKATLRIDPQDRRRVNVTVKTPRQNVTMTDIYAPIRIPRVNVRRSLFGSVMDQMSYDNSENTYQLSPTCKVQTRSIRTFDGQKYQAPLATCYSVVAKDCSDEQRFAVLMKKVSSSSNKKVVKIITQSTQLKLKKTESGFEVTRNGQKMNLNERSSEYDSNDQTEECYVSGTNIVCNMEDAGVKVYFDGVSAHIKTTNWYVGKLCGLCGHMNYEPSDDFQTPDYQPETDLRRFQRGYIYQDEECEENTLPEVENICDSEDCSYQSQYEPTASDESSMEIPVKYQSHYKKQRRPRQLNRMVQKMGKQCFSKEPIPSCPDYTYPKEARQEEKEYTCLDEFDQRAQEWIYEAQQTPIPELRNLPTSFSRMEIIPTSCKQHQQDHFEI